MQKMKRILSIVVTVCMLVSILSTGILAVSISEKPANGTTQGQPFAPGTGGSWNFRIPGIVTLDNGTLIAACDARWNHTGDGAGLDTIVSVSTDNGENWTYTFANYFGDNGNTYNNLSTCIIDPGIGTDGEKAYLIADLWPAGIALNTSKYSPVAGKTGYTTDGNLMLRDLAGDTVSIGGSGYNTMAANREYNYYLDLETLELCNADGSKVEGYTVDAYFNIVSNDGSVNTNLFFSDSPYQPYPTDYLYMTTSEDGLNWSAPTLLNLKEASEQTLLVGPGNGTYDAENDRMVFTAYEHTSGYERTSLIWMDAEGNWKRSEDCTVGNWSSEASAVVLDDGTVRVFYRDGFRVVRYTDMVWSEAAQNYVRDTAATEVNTTAEKDTGCQLTAIKYSEQIGGKDAIFLATPAGSARRTDGRIYVFLVNEDKSLELAYSYDITPDQTEAYAYSCLTELNNGDLALLWEGDNPETSGNAEIIYSVIPYDDIVTRENDPNLTFKAFELLTGDSKTFTDNSGYYGDADISELDTDVAELVMTGEEIITDAAQLGSNASYNGDTINLADCVYTFTKGENDRWSASAMNGTVYLYPGNTENTGYPNRNAAYANLSIFEGYEDGTFYIMSNDCDNANQSTSYLYFNRSGLTWDRVSDLQDRVDWMTNCSLRLYKPVEGAGSAEIPGYERVTELSAITDGEYLVVGPGSDGNLYALYPNTATTNRYCQIAKLLGRTTVGHTELTFTGMGPGYTEVQVGSIVYQITVADLSEVTVEIPVGTTVTVTEPNGNYSDADISALNTSVATVVLSGTNGTNASGVSPDPVSELTDGTYVILNTRANKLVNNTSASAGAEAGTMAGLRLDSSISSFEPSAAVWTFTAVDGGYTIQDASGKYMSIASNAAGLQDTAHTIHVERNGSTWVLEENNAYLNDAGGAGTTASGWQHSTARTDSGSQFAIYAYSEQSYGPSTELTFTGVYPGTTELTIGRTKFLITVTGDVHDVQLKTEESASYVIAGDQTHADTSALNESVATVELALTTVAHVSNGTGYNAEAVALADCLYTFTATADGYYEVSATTADGTTVYLNHYASGNNNPSITTPGKIDVQTSSHTNMFKLVAQVVSGGSGSTRGLHFHAEAAMPYWNRCGTDGTTDCHEYLYRPVREGEQSSAEIDGYVLVTDIADVVDGGQYLIVHNDNQGALYVLHPSSDANDKWSHVAKLAPATEVTFTGVGEGETSLTLPGHVFNISVTEAVCEHQWSDWTVTTEPDCTDAGVETRTCGLCGETEEQSVEALGHDYEAVVTAPTCTEGGYTTHTCSRCADSYISDETAALGHDFQDGICTRCGQSANPFIDVPKGAFFHDSVLWAYEQGIVAGVSDTVFDPYAPTTRAQIVTFLWRAEGCPEPTITECPFEDVNVDFAYQAILWAYETGITVGTDATHFSPNQTCNRAQIVTFLWRASGSPSVSLAENPFVDVPEGSFYHAPVLWAVENGITAGVSSNRFAPNKACTRSESVCFLYRHLAD